MKKNKHLEEAIHQWNITEDHSDWSNLYDISTKAGKSIRGKIHSSRRNKMLNIFDNLKLDKKSLILEVGYGAGLISSEVYKKGFKLTGVDLSEKFQKVATLSCNKIKKESAKKKNGEKLGSFKFLVGNVNKLPFPDNHFDCVLGSAFFHYMTFPEKTLKEIYRVIKPGGHFIIGQRNMYSVSQFDTFLGVLRTIYYLLSRTEWETSHKAFATKKRLISYPRIMKQIRKTKFKLVKYSGAGYHARGKIIQKLYYQLFRYRFFSNNLIFVLKK